MTSTTPTITDLAEWAEDRFAGLCSFAGVTRNKANQDRTGWDYLVEFPPTKMPDIPADLQPTEKSARVQIKSKQSGPASMSIKLSNALRFAKDPLPCFVILFLASNGSEPVRIFGKHFWKDEIGQTLIRARKAHADNKPNLNRQTVTLSFHASEEHTHDLLAWMAETIVKFGESYADAKATLARTLGFEEGRFHGRIQFKLQDLQAFVDHQIGLSPGAPPLVVSVKEKRFGIEARAPLFEGTPDFVRIQSHPQPCRIRIRGETSNDIWLDGNLFSPALPNLPTEFRKVRVVADFIEIILTATPGGEVTLHIGNNERRSLPKLRTLVGVLLAAREGPLHFQVSRVGSGALPFSASLPIENDLDELRQLSYICDCLKTVSDGILPPELSLSLAEIYRAWNSIVDFNGMVTGKEFKGRFTFVEELPTVERKPSGLIFHGYVDIGDWTFMAVVRRPIEKFEVSGRVCLLACGNPRVIEAIVRPGSGAVHSEDIRDLYVRVREMEPDVIELFEGDFRTAIAAQRQLGRSKNAATGPQSLSRSSK